MQSLKDLAFMVSEKKQTLKFFSNEKKKKKKSRLSPLNMCETQKEWYVHDLLDIINNHTKFKLNWIRRYNFWLKLCDTAMTLKSSQGHWKWYEWVKLNEYYHHAKFELIILVLPEKTATLKFLLHTANWPAGQPNTDHYIDSYFSFESIETEFYISVDCWDSFIVLFQIQVGEFVGNHYVFRRSEWDISCLLFPRVQVHSKVHSNHTGLLCQNSQAF